MNQSTLLKEIRQELKQNIDTVYRDGERRFFKEKIKNYGVRLPHRRKIAAKYWPKIKHLSKKEIFFICNKLFSSGYNEEFTLASSWVYKLKNQFQLSDFKTFEVWVKKYVDNWAKCDDFCTHTLGYFVDQYPQFSKHLLLWTKSKNRWLKRASAVTLIYPYKKPKKLLTTIFQIAENLLLDSDDMVQKGYGWMLKDASAVHQQQVFNFVLKHKYHMPRTALRYAIEKMPKKLKQQAMTKD